MSKLAVRDSRLREVLASIKANKGEVKSIKRHLARGMKRKVQNIGIAPIGAAKECIPLRFDMTSPCLFLFLKKGSGIKSIRRERVTTKLLME
jgi:hypothetical protein